MTYQNSSIYAKYGCARHAAAAATLNIADRNVTITVWLASQQHQYTHCPLHAFTFAVTAGRRQCTVTQWATGGLCDCVWLADSRVRTDDAGLHSATVSVPTSDTSPERHTEQKRNG